MKILNIPSEFPYILITGLSGDGSVVIGNVWNSTKSQAFRWVNDTVIFLPNPQQYYSISATSISADGSVIAGSLISGTQSVAARWIGNKEFIIDTFPNAGIWKNAPPHITSISSDHFVMIGSVRVGNTSSAYRWYVDGRSDNLNETYANLLDFGSELIHVYDASSDGRFIVGQGYNSVSRRNEAFILDTQGTPSSSTDVNEKSIISLYPITPNPINGISTIHFSTPEKTYATLSIVDILGRKIATLADQEFESGKHSQTFDASTLSGGLYYCQLKIGETVKSQKMIIMK